MNGDIVSFLQFSTLIIFVLWAGSLVFVGVLARLGISEAVSQFFSLIISISLALALFRVAIHQKFPVIRVRRARPLESRISWGWLLSTIAFVWLATECYGGWALATGTLAPTSSSSVSSEMQLAPMLLLMMVSSSVLIGPFYEEILYRGLLMASLRERWGYLLAVAANSLLFGLMHFRSGWTTYLVLNGVVFSIIALRSNRLWPAILAHSILNLTSVVRSRVVHEDTWLFASYANEANLIFFVAGVAVFYIVGMVSAWRISSSKIT